MSDNAIPEFSKSSRGHESGEVSLSNLSAFATGPGDTTRFEIAVSIAVAVLIIGSVEAALRLFEVPHYILPPPSALGSWPKP